MNFLQNGFQDTIEREDYSLEDLSERLQISMQTLVRWADRHLIDAELAWELTDENEEMRVIRLRKGKLETIREFAEEYRESYVTQQEARRILKMIDRNQVRRLMNAGDVSTKKIDDETKVHVGSIEDYLRTVEQEREE